MPEVLVLCRVGQTTQGLMSAVLFLQVDLVNVHSELEWGFVRHKGILCEFLWAWIVLPYFMCDFLILSLIVLDQINGIIFKTPGWDCSEIFTHIENDGRKPAWRCHLYLLNTVLSGAWLSFLKLHSLWLVSVRRVCGEVKASFSYSCLLSLFSNKSKL